MRMGWVLGWAIPRSWFAPWVAQAFPADEHVYFDAAPGVRAEIARAGPLDRLAGYSLGSLLLLQLGLDLGPGPGPGTKLEIGAGHSGLAEKSVAPPPLPERVALLAPIFAFSKEEGLGGRVARAQVRHLARWARRDPAGAIADFSARAGLGLPAPALTAAATAASAEILNWGLGLLQTVRIEPAMPAGWRAYCGEKDPLLDAMALQRCVPEVAIVAGATHHPRELLRALRDSP